MKRSRSNWTQDKSAWREDQLETRLGKDVNVYDITREISILFIYYPQTLSILTRRPHTNLRTRGHHVISTSLPFTWHISTSGALVVVRYITVVLNYITLMFILRLAVLLRNAKISLDDLTTSRPLGHRGPYPPWQREVGLGLGSKRLLLNQKVQSSIPEGNLFMQLSSR